MTQIIMNMIFFSFWGVYAKVTMQWRIQRFFKGGSTIKFGFHRWGFYYYCGFSKGVPLSKCVIFTLFCQIFRRKRCFQPPELPLWIRHFPFTMTDTCIYMYLVEK
jgi:hypothetical protein